MNSELITETHKKLNDAVEYSQRQLNREVSIRNVLLPLLPKLSDDVRVYPGQGNLLVYVFNREDLQTLMTLATTWKKQPASDGIYYITQPSENIHDIPINILAKNDALPATCIVEEYDDVIPAQEAKVIKRQRVRCDITLETHEVIKEL